MVIEFPHASTILIPSATITHSNVPVADGDLRTSFTQFCSGNLFRYVDNGYCTDAELFRKCREQYYASQELKSMRWPEGLKLYSNIKELLEQVD